MPSLFKKKVMAFKLNFRKIYTIKSEMKVQLKEPVAIMVPAAVAAA